MTTLTSSISIQRPKWFHVNFLAVSSLLAVLVLGLGWMNFSTIEESVTGMGQLLPDSKIREIMAPESGIVSEVYVSENQEVKAGQPLVAFDPELSQDQQSAMLTQLSLLNQEVSDLRSATNGRASNSAWASAMQESRSTALTDAQLQITKSEHLLSQAMAKQNHLKELIASREQLLGQYKQLVKDGGLSQREYKLFEQDFINQRSLLAQANEEVEARQTELQQVKVRPANIQANYQKDILSKLNDTQQRMAMAQSEVARSRFINKHTIIYAPMDGVINQQLVHGPGEVAQAGHPLFTIVPKNAQMVAEVKVSNKDVAYITQGQQVALQFEAAPYQQFGKISGKIIGISPSTIFDKEGHPYFLIKIKPEKTTLSSDNGKRTVQLKAGMTVTANIITQEKSILKFLTEPIQDQFARSLKDPSTY